MADPTLEPLPIAPLSVQPVVEPQSDAGGEKSAQHRARSRNRRHHSRATSTFTASELGLLSAATAESEGGASASAGKNCIMHTSKKEIQPRARRRVRAHSQDVYYSTVQ